MASKRDTRKAWQDAMDKIAVEAALKFPDNSGKLHQLAFHLTTAAMVVDDLHDYPPFVPHTF